MSAKKFKLLRRMAHEEMVGDPPVDYVAAPRCRTSMVNSPNSVRGFYLQLKKAFKRMPTR